MSLRTGTARLNQWISHAVGAHRHCSPPVHTSEAEPALDSGALWHSEPQLPALQRAIPVEVRQEVREQQGVDHSNTGAKTASWERSVPQQRDVQPAQPEDHGDHRIIELVIALCVMAMLLVALALLLPLITTQPAVVGSVVLLTVLAALASLVRWITGGRQ